MKNVLVRDLDRKTIDALKKRATANQHSFNAELRQILEEAASKYAKPDAIDMVNEVFEQYSNSGKTYTDSAEYLRSDRDNR